MDRTRLWGSSSYEVEVMQAVLRVFQRVASEAGEGEDERETRKALGSSWCHDTEERRPYILEPRDARRAGACGSATAASTLHGHTSTRASLRASLRPPRAGGPSYTRAALCFSPSSWPIHGWQGHPQTRVSLSLCIAAHAPRTQHKPQSSRDRAAPPRRPQPGRRLSSTRT